MYFKLGIAVAVVILFHEGVTAESGNRIRRFANDGCDELIPAFIDQILKNGNTIAANDDCGKSGKFPKPGDCTVFFKCVHARGRIMPFVEYCANGYTFVNDSCIRSSNDTDCPQYNCVLLEQNEDNNGQAAQETTSTSLQNDSVENEGDNEKSKAKVVETVFAAQHASTENGGRHNLPIPLITVVASVVASKALF